jgi:hypothetical protein
VLANICLFGRADLATHQDGVRHLTKAHHQHSRS